SNVQYREGIKEKSDALFKEHGPAQVIVAKTFLSFGDKDNLVPLPEPGYTLTVRDVKYESGADVYVVVLGQKDPRLMPGKVSVDGTPKDKVVHLMAAPGWPGGYLPAGQD
ncbi:formate--tetrahydrofolate ligase, partial [Candidatus Poribacteria bacterium]|nr:formate--tetrahydrofolate ligase [Candidatus Poribacteria bacterium]